jgi:HEAT repeat protein
VRPLAAQRPAALDETTVGVLANVLAATDARRFDPAVLREALSHPNPAVRRQGALAAGRIGDGAALDLLLPALRDTVPAVQAAAAFALGLLKDARAIPALLETIRAVSSSEQGAPQLEAVTAIAKIGGDDGARAISDVIAEGSSPALLESWRLGARAPVAQLVRFTDASDVETRGRALYALARLRAGPGAAALVRALNDPDPQIRTVATRGISKALLDSARLDPRDAINALRRLLNDADAHIRINALRSLASFKDSTLSASAVPLMTDRDIGVAVQAETTLGVLGGSRALEALRGRLASSVFTLRRQALIGLSQADSAAGVAAAGAIEHDNDWRWRSVAAEAFGAAHARTRLEAQLADPDGRVVAQALQMLQRIVPATDATLELARARAPDARRSCRAERGRRSSCAPALGGRHRSARRGVRTSRRRPIQRRAPLGSLGAGRHRRHVGRGPGTGRHEVRVRHATSGRLPRAPSRRRYGARHARRMGARAAGRDRSLDRRLP